MSENKEAVSSKRKNGLNLIDVFLIVLFVVVVGAFLAYRFLVAGDAGETVYLEYSIEVTDVGENVNTAKLAGDTLYNEEDVLMGTVVGNSKVQIGTRTVTVGDAEERRENVRYMTVTVGSEAIRMKDGSYRIGDAFLTAGQSLVLYSNDFAIEGSCVQIVEVIK